jgi:hypothetical protein
MTALENQKKGDEDICDVCHGIYATARNDAWEEMGEKYPVAVKYTMMFAETLKSRFDERKLTETFGDKAVEILKACRDTDLDALDRISKMPNPPPVEDENQAELELDAEEPSD